LITTQQKRVPWSWVVAIVAPALIIQLNESCANAAMSFTTRKFTKIPYIITLVTSSHVLLNMFISPYVSWKSDRIWTRYGRRKPFLIAGWTGVATALALMPLAPSLPVLILAAILFGISMDLTSYGPFDPLVNEVIPQPQRGRAQSIRMLFTQSGQLLFMGVLIKNFKEKNINGISWLTGERLLYWVVAGAVLLCVLHFHLFVKEKEVPVKPGENRFSFKPFITGIFGERQHRMIFILVFASVALNAGLASLGPLMTTEQFGYDMKTLGNLGVANTVIRMCIILPVVGFVADRVNRMKMFQWTMILTTMYPLCWWGYIHFFAPRGIPPIKVMIFSEFCSAIVHMMDNCTVGPLLFDFIPRNKMGTVYAGMTWVRGITRIIAINGVGVFVTYYNRLLPRVDGITDYSSGFLYVFLIYVLGLAGTFYFASQARKGRVLPLGKAPIQTSEPEPELAAA